MLTEAKFPMFAMPFGRLVWKEYRVHQALWLWCFGAGVAIHILNHFFFSVDGLHIAFVPLYSMLYGIGCGALLFASERESRASDWLLSLSIPPGITVAAKMTFAVASTIAMQVAMVVLWILFNADMAGRLDQYQWAFLFFPAALIALVWSWLGSVLSRRVVVALLAAVFWPVMLLVLANLIFDSFVTHWAVSMPQYGVEGWRFATFRGLMIAVGCIDIWLGWRWCQGKYIDGTVIEIPVHRFASWCATQIPLHSDLIRIPAQAEFEYSWRRSWQRLVWQERHRETLHLFLLVILCAMSLILAAMDGFLGDGTFRSQSRLTIIVLALSLLIPILMGVLGFESDIGSNQLRFLCNRGISPAVVWLAKQSIWISRAFWITAVVFASGCYFEWLFGPTFRFGRPLNAEQIHAPFEIALAELRTVPHLCAWYIVLSYCCGQLCSICFRRTILAIVFAILLTVIVVYWMSWMCLCAMPLWWTLGFPVICMLLITLWQMRYVLLEDFSLQRQLRLCCYTVVIAPAMLIAGVEWIRTHEVSALPGLNDRSKDSWRIILDEEKEPRSFSVEESSVSQQLLQLENARPRHADEIIQLMNKDLSRVQNSYRLDEDVIESRRTGSVLRLNNAADASLSLDKRIAYYLALLKLDRLSAVDGHLFGTWAARTDFQCETLERIIHWANDPGQTSDSVRSTIKAVRSELRQFPSAARAVVDSYLRDIRAIDEPSIQAYIQYKNHLVDHSYYELTGLGIETWERKRLTLLLTREAEYIFTDIYELETDLQNKSGLPNGTNDELPISYRKKSSDPLLTSANRSLSIARELVLQREMVIRAALTRMELIAYRLETGRLPHRLDNSKTAIDGRVLIDPWSGRMFDYSPTFLFSTGNKNVDAIRERSNEAQTETDFASVWWSIRTGEPIRASSTQSNWNFKSRARERRVQTPVERLQAIPPRFPIPPKPEIN